MLWYNWQVFYPPPRQIFLEIIFADRMKDKFARIIKGQCVSLAIDGGKVQRKLQTVSVLCDKKSYFWKATKVLHNDHETILSILEEAKGALEGMGADLVAVVGDNHSGIQKVAFLRCQIYVFILVWFRQWISSVPNIPRSSK